MTISTDCIHLLQRSSSRKSRPFAEDQTWSNVNQKKFSKKNKKKGFMHSVVNFRIYGAEQYSANTTSDRENNIIHAE